MPGYANLVVDGVHAGSATWRQTDQASLPEGTRCHPVLSKPTRTVHSELRAGKNIARELIDAGRRAGQVWHAD
jgi:hypothetical protein